MPLLVGTASYRAPLGSAGYTVSVPAKPWWRDPKALPPWFDEDTLTPKQKRMWDVFVVGFLLGLFVLNLWYPRSLSVGVFMVVCLGVYAWNRTLGPGRTRK